MLSLTQENQDELVHSIVADRSCGLDNLLSENTKVMAIILCVGLLLLWFT